MCPICFIGVHPAASETVEISMAAIRAARPFLLYFSYVYGSQAQVTTSLSLSLSRLVVQSKAKKAELQSAYKLLGGDMLSGVPFTFKRSPPTWRSEHGWDPIGVCHITLTRAAAYVHSV